MFWDFGSAAGDHVQKSASTLLRIATHCPHRLRKVQKTYEIIRGNNIRVGAESFRCTLQNIMKCDDGIRKELHDSVMLFNGTDALKGSVSA